MEMQYLILGMIVMSAMTYAIRVTPMVVFRKKITNQWIKSFLYYVPYAVLSAMTFPAVFYCTESKGSAGVGCIVAIILAYFKRSLLTVAVGAAVGVYVAVMLGL